MDRNKQADDLYFAAVGKCAFAVKDGKPVDGTLRLLLGASQSDYLRLRSGQFPEDKEVVRKLRLLAGPHGLFFRDMKAKELGIEFTTLPEYLACYDILPRSKTSE